MNTDDTRNAALDARLRRMLGGLDASAGFEERIMRRVAGLATAGAVPPEELRARFERRRKRVRRRLRREAWMNGVTIAGLGACAGGLLWRYAPAIRRLAEAAAWQLDPALLATGTLAALGVAVWLLLKQTRSAR